MKIVILGGGPAGLYAGLLIKKADPAQEITILERNPPDVTYGWGVVFSDRTLASFQRADYKTYEQIASQFVIWDSIDTWYRGEVIRCGGHVIASISRKLLLSILQQRCLELGIDLRFRVEINDLAELPPYDLLIAADGLNSLVRRAFAGDFQPQITLGKAKYIWLGAEKVLDAFTFIFRENEHGLFQVHAYPFSGTTSTFIVECTETTWLNAGLDKADEAASLTYCERLLADDLGNARLLSNNSKWISFPTLKTRHWRHGKIVLLGDSAHTAHFSIGSGTKLAMEDAIALAGALEQHHNLDTALNTYELERKPVVETFQRAAQESQNYFETLKRYLGLEPMQFTFQLLTRSGRITYDDLKLRDVRFGDAVDRWMVQQSTERPGRQITPIIASPPALTPFRLRALTLPNRVIMKHRSACAAEEGTPTETYSKQLQRLAERGAALVMTDPVAISAYGRITPADAGIYESNHQAIWAQAIEQIHTQTSAKIALQLGHAGRRGAARPRDAGLDRPLHEGAWPLLSASPLPYTAQSQTPKEVDRDDMAHIRREFVQAAQMAGEAGFDWLHLNFAQGYLLASFLSPLSNKRADEYGGSLENRLRFPLEVFDAVRAAWPEDRLLSVALTVSDCAKGGLGIQRAVMMAQAFREHGCDMIEVLAGQTIPDAEPAYGRGFLTSLSDRIRNEAGIATMVGGYLTTSDEVNTILAAGRADLCIMEPLE
jgi:anthraniloyl-CoA monooxygenase